MPSAPTRPVGLLDEAGDLTAFSGRSLRALPGVLRHTSEVLRQAASMIRGTSLLLFVMAGFIGFTATSFGFFFLRSIGATDFTGVVPGIVTPRLGATLMFGYVFAAKLGCSIAAELGAAKVNDELDAYESEALDPYRYLVGTRICGALIFIPIAAALALVGMYVGGFITAIVVLDGLTAEGYNSVTWAVQSLTDQVYMFITVLTIGITVVLVACFYGFRTSGGPAAVGWAVSRSVTVNLVFVHLIAAFFVLVFYGTDVRWPMGG